jgi:oligopeptidase B
MHFTEILTAFRRALCGVLLIITALAGCARHEEVAAPMARVEPRADTLFGDIRVDNYFWLRERSHPEVLSYLRAENEYTRTMMKPTEKLQETIFQELKGRMVETDTTAAEKIDDYWYYTRTEAGRGYPLYCRRKDGSQAAEEILLDQNLLAQGRDYCEIGAYRPSPDHRLLAYSVDTTGAEIYTIYFKDLRNGRVLPETIAGAYEDLEWAGDTRTIYYSTMDPALRPYRLYRHRLGTDQSADELLYQEDDEMYYLELSKSRSRGYVLVTLESKVTTEVRFLSAASAAAALRVVQPRRHGVEYYVHHHGENFYILTNDEAENFRLMMAPVGRSSRAFWKEVIAHSDTVTINDVDVFEHHLVLYERRGGLKRIRIQNLRTGRSHEVDFPEPLYTVWPAENPDFNTPVLRFNYSSLVTPRTVYDYHMDERTREKRKRYRVRGGYDPSQYHTERIWASAPDGTEIPISLVYKKGTVLEGTHPLHLHGYGSYGSSTEPKFSHYRLSLLDRGFIYGIAHVRGGGVMGRKWYQDGKLLNKKNTFTDFITCAQHLIDRGYTSSDRLIVSGESAGGLLMGAVANMRPDLFRAIVAEVPFVDVINTMLDATIPLTVTEYEEWGNPKDKEYYDYMKAYSPYDNVEAKQYPHMLITAGLNDPRVQYWEPAKWTARLRAAKTGDHLLLLRTNMGSGHFGQSERYDYLREVAFLYAFMCRTLDIE